MYIPGFLLRLERRNRARRFSLDELDVKLERYLDFEDGFFVEAGANDGVTQSNTLYFERFRRWSGLLVEPVPSLASRCQAVRSRALTANCALGSFAQRNTSVDMTYCNLMSVVDGAMPSAEAQAAHIELGVKVQNLKTYRLNVPCIPLSDLIDRYGIGRIDLFSLDVEGYEANALAGLDFARHRPRFMLIEARHREDIEAVINPFYEVAAELTARDILYRCKVETDSVVGFNASYASERKWSHLKALACLHER